MRKALTVFLILFVCICAHAQKSPAKFGDVPMEDLKMTVYPQDSSAEAVMLFDYGEAHVEDREVKVKLVYKRHVRIKILKSGGTSWGDARFFLFKNSGSEDRVTGFKASTYNLENGKIVESPLQKENIFKENFDKYRSIQKFTFPNVKVGSVLEYTFSTTSDNWTVFPNWAFQRTIPIRHSEYWAVMPAAYVYEKYMQGYITPSYELTKATAYDLEVKNHHWIMENSPAFKEEPYMTSESDYISRVNFALAGVNTVQYGYKDYQGTWETIGKDFSEWESFGLAITRSGFLKSKAEELTAGITDPGKKIEAINAYVRENINWDGSYEYAASPLKQVMEAKKGDSGDINILLASLLDKAGIPVQMVLLSTRDHGFIRQQFPMRRQFNYTVCMVKVNDKAMFLDATQKYLPTGVLPDWCLNGEGLIVSATTADWIETTSKTKDKTLVSADFAIDGQGEMKGKVVYSRDGYAAHEMRAKYNGGGEEKYLKDFLAGREWTVNKTEFTDVKELSKPVKETHEVTIEEHASVAGDIIYVNPFVTAKENDNPFVQPTRVYPVDFGTPIEKFYTFKLAIPEGFQVDELPKSKAIVLPGNGARYSYNVAQMGSIINVTSTLVISKPLFVQDEYPTLREFYAQVIAKQAEQIVLKKK